MTLRPHPPLRIVLIGSSLEDESDQAVRAGLALARTAGARVYLAHAAPFEPRLESFELGPDIGLLREQIAAREERLRQQIERLGIGADELAGTSVLAGAPHRVLIQVAETVRPDLLVVGATGSGPLAAELLGSTADRVLRKALCPVLLVRGELRLPPRRVLAPVDLSTLSRDAFRCGLHLLAQLTRGEAAQAAQVRAVHALSFLDALAIQRKEQGRISSGEAERYCAEELRRFVLENRAEASFEVETAVLLGEARFEIVRELNEHPVDLVVLGTQGRGGLDRLILGSVASTVARKAPCSVLLISPEASLAEGIADAITTQAASA